MKIPIYRAKKLGTENEYVEGYLEEHNKGDFYISLMPNKIDAYKIDISTISIHFPNMLAKDSDRYNSSGEKDLRVFASLQLDGKGGDLVGYAEGHINYNVAERYVISEDGVLFLRDIVPNIKKYTLDKEIASWYKIYGIQQ